MRVRVAKVLWFGEPKAWPVRLDAAALPPASCTSRAGGPTAPAPGVPQVVAGAAGALLVLLPAWLLLVRPAVLSAAREATDDRAQEIVQAAEPVAPAEQPGGGQPPAGEQAQGQGQGQGHGTVGGSEQSSGTIEVRTNAGQQATGTYVVPAGKVFHITDIVAANFQGDEGVLTIEFGERTITAIALETFRNQDYHWVTPIEIPEHASVTARVTVTTRHTRQRQEGGRVRELLNVSGELGDIAG